MCGGARLRKKMKNAYGAFWCLVYPSLGAWSCACHTESSVDLREQIPKNVCVSEILAWGESVWNRAGSGK